MPRKPTEKQLLAAEGIAQGKSPYRAYLDAGYAESVAKTKPYRSENVRIRQLVEDRKAYLMQLAQVHTELITGSLVEIMQGSAADVLPENKILQRARENGVDRLIKKISVTPMRLGVRSKTNKDGSIVETPVIGEKIDLEMYSRLDAIAQLRDNFGMKQEPRANTYEATRQAEVEKEIEKIMQAEACSEAEAAKMLLEALGSDSPLIPTVNKYVN